MVYEVRQRSSCSHGCLLCRREFAFYRHLERIDRSMPPNNNISSSSLLRWLKWTPKNKYFVLKHIIYTQPYKHISSSTYLMMIEPKVPQFESHHWENHWENHLQSQCFLNLLPNWLPRFGLAEYSLLRCSGPKKINILCRNISYTRSRISTLVRHLSSSYDDGTKGFPVRVSPLGKIIFRVSGS